MHTLSSEDKAHIAKSLQKFKIIVPRSELDSQCDTEILKELFDNVLDLSLRYAESVCAFQRIVAKHAGTFDEGGERQAIEEVRGSIHDSFITSVNVLCRMMIKAGKPSGWRNRIGEDRAALGKFALTLAFEQIRNDLEKGGGR